MDSKELPKCSQDIRNFNNVITFTPNKAQPEKQHSSHGQTSNEA